MTLQHFLDSYLMGSTPLDSQEGLLQSIGVLVAEDCSDSAAEAAACALMNITVS